MGSTVAGTAVAWTTLPELAGRIRVPTYDRAAMSVGIMHLGVGGFHRSHQAMYLDRLMASGRDLDWALRGVGVLPHDRRIVDALNGQDGLYTLVMKYPDGRLEPRIIGSITGMMYLHDDPRAVVEAMAVASVRIVSLTITEGGYLIDSVTGEFDVRHPSIQPDLQPGAEPETAFGLITAALALRRSRGIAPFTVMSCDNVPGNGHVARRAIVSFARLLDPAQADWIDQSVAFPNSMVDRITPGTTDADRAALAEQFGVHDVWPVVCEPFTQWVLEDNFPTGRPAWEEVGVQLVQDVAPYELMKLRMLNAGHQVVCYLGALAGFGTAMMCVRIRPSGPSSTRSWPPRQPRPCRRCPGSTSMTTAAHWLNGSQTHISATPWRGYVPTPRTGSRSSCSRRCGTTWLMVALSSARPWSSQPGRVTPRGSMMPATRSRSWIRCGSS